MARPYRLYSLALHFGLRIFTAVFGGIAAAISVATVASGEREPIAFVAMGVIVLTVVVLARVVWRTRRVVIEGDHLVIGHARRGRRVDFGDVISCQHPWWVFSDRFAAPLELTIRGGDTLTFFPEVGAAEMIEHRRRGARSEP